MGRNQQLLPIEAMRLLSTEGKLYNREVIIQYLVGEAGTVKLNPEQENLLQRWSAADDMMRNMETGPNEIALALMKKFEYSVATARRDISNAQYVFGSMNVADKRYVISRHLDLIDDCIRKAIAAGKDKLWPILLQVKNKAIEMMPDTQKTDTTPAALIFNIHVTQAADLGAGTITQADAEENVKNYLKTLGEIIPFEDGK